MRITTALTTGDVGNPLPFRAFAWKTDRPMGPVKYVAHDDAPGNGFQIKKGIPRLPNSGILGVWGCFDEPFYYGANQQRFPAGYCRHPHKAGQSHHRTLFVWGATSTWAKGSTQLSNGKQVAVAWKKLADDKIGNGRYR